MFVLIDTFARTATYWLQAFTANLKDLGKAAAHHSFPYVTRMSRLWTEGQ